MYAPLVTTHVPHSVCWCAEKGTGRVCCVNYGWVAKAERKRERKKERMKTLITAKMNFQTPGLGDQTFFSQTFLTPTFSEL